MTQEERYGNRDGTYSAWHRRLSTQRFVGLENAQLLAMIDIDVIHYVEYNDLTKDPICLIETAQDVGQSRKPATVTKKLAEKAKLHAFTVLYTPSINKNPVDKRWPDIKKFRVKMIAPDETLLWKEFTPEEWAKALLSFRVRMDEENIRKLFDNVIEPNGDKIEIRLRGRILRFLQYTFRLNTH